MFTTPEQVQEWTGQLVTSQDIRLAQTILEVWIGRVEEEIENVNDLSILARATAFQVVYMDNSGVDPYQQIGVTVQSSADMAYRFDTDRGSPHISRHAYEALRRLSWMGSRSVKVGPIRTSASRNWRDEWMRT